MDRPPHTPVPPCGPADDRRSERESMVRDQLVDRNVDDPEVLAAMRRVPRHRFVGPDQFASAYDDSALPLAAGQTISQPYIVAYMSAAARIRPNDKVLEIGTGSGYQAAVLAELGAQVFTIERIPELAAHAASVLADLGYPSVSTREGDGTQGWPEEAPFEAILVTAAPGNIPPALREQLADGGRLVIPVGRDPLPQHLVLVTRHGRKFHEERLLPVRFVPLVSG